MKKLAKVALVLAVSSGAIVGGSLAGFSIAVANSPAPPVQVQGDDGSLRPVEKFSVNESGQTYGLVDQGLLSDSSVRPQLVLVTTDEGVEGYAYYAELFPAAMAKSTTEAKQLSTDQPYEVPVYDVDGRTFIGIHTVNRLPEG
jgi:hypothetical protein